MPFEIVSERDWITSRPDGTPTDGLRVTVLDLDTGETFNVEVPSKLQAEVNLAVAARIEQRRGISGMRFE